MYLTFQNCETVNFIHQIYTLNPKGSSLGYYLRQKDFHRVPQSNKLVVYVFSVRNCRQSPNRIFALVVAETVQRNRKQFVFLFDLVNTEKRYLKIFLPFYKEQKEFMSRIVNVSFAEKNETVGIQCSVKGQCRHRCTVSSKPGLDSLPLILGGRFYLLETFKSSQNIFNVNNTESALSFFLVRRLNTLMYPNRRL